MTQTATQTHPVNITSLNITQLDRNNHYGKDYYITKDTAGKQDGLYKLLRLDPKKHNIILRFKDGRRSWSYGSLFNNNFNDMIKNTEVSIFIEDGSRWSYYDRNDTDRVDVTVPVNTLSKIRLSNDVSYYNYIDGLELTFDHANGSFKLPYSFKFLESNFGLIVNDKLDFIIDGKSYNIPIENLAAMFEGPSYSKSKNVGNKIKFDFDQISYVNSRFDNHNSIKAILKGIVKHKNEAFQELPNKGIAKALSVVTPFYDQIFKEEPLMVAMFRTFAFNSHRTINNVKVATVFNDYFKDIKTVEEFKNVLESILKITDYGKKSFDSSFDAFGGVKDKRKTYLKTKSTGAFNKMMADRDFIDISEETHPLTYAAITDGRLPMTVFFKSQNSEQYFMFNDNWDLWEEMLEKYPVEAIELADTVRGRTTYEKDIMSYMHFVLHSLPEYLEKHTGKKWTGIPKLVTSSTELDPPKEGDNGVSKTRSALTPIVDNENCTVEIPYASLHVSGSYGTTYCYSHNYSVLTTGLSVNGSVVTKEVEEKLNGRDDYGLMYYTLTGSANGRGYPSFLVIFEHLDNNTRVHFHRAHPMRSKDGDYNPIHQWIKGCYKWMVGNVNFERTEAQQGDLVFIKSLASNLEKQDFIEVNQYDSHKFDRNVKYSQYKSGKENILGYFLLEEDTWLRHPEHKDRLIPAGEYELRQCRSWEANPRGVWSLRID